MRDRGDHWHADKDLPVHERHGADVDPDRAGHRKNATHVNWAYSVEKLFLF